MVDLIKRVCIALALAAFIGMLFITTTTSFAAEYESGFMEDLIWPTVGEVTDSFGTRDGKHYGIDIAAPEGTPVVSVAGGTVSRSYHSHTYGQVVFIKHDNGLETVYAHLHERSVNEGEQVKEGERIGSVGNTGRSSGNHLHFEVHHGSWNPEKSDSIDPLHVLSSETEAMYAAVGGAFEGEALEERKTVETLSVRSEHQESEEHLNEDEKALYVQVEPGDTLWGIASDFRVTVQHLQQWNGLDSDLITVGSVLVVYPERFENAHVIEHGETLSAIAAKYELTAEQIIELNQLSSDLIYPGQLLTIKE
ncbi:peptidoglycan DD-metalloendopeptidase family protein [Alkalihalobacillus oceani]|uniref:peptidoglycan DD-metalloendopeptidase family protein n=1 Tax=Halalkalibacter oceani TaxID=1653776 RepID=UPI00203CE716|nr:peptidoglycan DD-metalloendopeptidase family protein [Halalkalibacter oceani]MCM3763002.1 peptidoglycan DD-metalloendopeptidase family protein [Halalkalibacter oceani]